MGRKKHVEEGGGESWLMSYCDMITLLVTFFLMMMTFSTSEHGDIKEVGVGLLKGRGGVWPPMLGASFRERLDPSVVKNFAQDLDELSDDTDGSVGMRKTIDGLTLQFDAECSFAAGSAEPPPKLVESLRFIARTLAPYRWSMVIEGSTDSAFTPTAQHPSATSMGLARACAAARVVLDDPRIPRERVQVASFGADRPLASNDTAVGRRINRCVSVRILASAVDAAAHDEPKAR